MIIFFYILLAICELIFAAIILTEIYWLVTWLAERVVKPLWYKLEDFVLRIYCWAITEEWLSREEVSDERGGSQSASDPAGSSGEGSV